MSQLPAELNNVPPELFPDSDDDKYLCYSHNDRWEHLKPVVIKLYTGNYGKNNKPPTIAQIVSFMKKYYSFHAAANEYPHRFRAWGVSDRRLTKAMVDEIVAAVGRRSDIGMSTSRITLKRGEREEKLDVKRVRRHLDRGSPVVQPESIQSGWLSSWTRPYAALISALPSILEAASPYGTQPLTPDYLTIDDCGTGSPRGEDSPSSPNMQLLLQKAKDDRTSLFLQGRLKNLITSMSQDDRRICFDYFHEFYMHSFVTAKNWQPPSLIVNNPTLSASSHFSPLDFLKLPLSPLPPYHLSNSGINKFPTRLCGTGNHVRKVQHTILSDLSHDTGSISAQFAGCLQTAIANGQFTELNVDNLPLSHGTIVQSLTENPNPLQWDTWKLAIMAGNMDLLFHLCKEYARTEDSGDDVGTIHPYHLAASFLNAAGLCCGVFETLQNLCTRSWLARYNVNDSGHTVFDSLLVSVLRSHTRVRPGTVSHEFGVLSSFPGEEKDICGRWDADSPEVRELFIQGHARVPTGWRHPFCHSAVQAICHCTTILFGTSASPDINCLSGLFLRRCKECGMELRLGPLHALVVTAFFLGQSGMVGETLFGPLAILVCLMSMGVDVTMKANVSVEEIMMCSGTGLCRHWPMTAAEMLQSVSRKAVERWSDACQAGWDSLLLTLLYGEYHPLDRDDQGQEPPVVFSDHSDGEPRAINCGFGEWFNQATNIEYRNNTIRALWVAIQKEFLTYRRSNVNDPWISDSFKMDPLRSWLCHKVKDFNTPFCNKGCGETHQSQQLFLVEGGGVLIMSLGKI